MPVFPVPIRIPVHEPPPPPVEVWIVNSWISYEGESTLGVFSDLGKAQAYVYTQTPAIELKMDVYSDDDIVFTRKRCGYGYNVHRYTLDQPGR